MLGFGGRRGRPAVGLLVAMGMVGACGGEEFSSGGSRAGGGAPPGGSAGTGAESGGGAGGGDGGTTATGGGGEGAQGGSGGSGGLGGAAGAGGSGGLGTGAKPGIDAGPVVTCPSGGLVNLTDDFAGGLNTIKWKALTSSNGSEAVFSTSGFLVIKLGYATGNWGGVWSTTDYAVDECMAWVRVQPAPPPATTTFFIGKDDGNGMLIESFWAAAALQLRYSAVNADSHTQKQEASALPATAWWRMRIVSGIVYFDTSPDGSTWSERFNAPKPPVVLKAYVSLLARMGAQGNNPAAKFDLLNL